MNTNTEINEAMSNRVKTPIKIMKNGAVENLKKFIARKNYF